MTSHPQGMLFVATNIGGDDEADFNLWYDNEHVAERVAISGFISGTRYRARHAGRCYLGPVSYTHLTLPTIYSV